MNTQLSPFLNGKFLLLALSMVISANLVFLLYSYFHWNEGYWAIVTIVAVASVSLSHTFTKMWARLIGTILGALYASVAAHFFFSHLPLFCLVLSLGVLLFSIIALQRSALSYSGVMGNVTMLIVLGASSGSDNFSGVALERFYQVCFGVIILALVNSLLLRIHLKEHKPHRMMLESFAVLWRELKFFNVDRALLLTALKVVIAMLITVLPWLIFKYPGGFWAPISCFFIIEHTLEKSKQKSKYRFLSHLAAALFGLVAILLFKNHLALLFIPLSIGLIICCYVLASDQAYQASGNTMAIALTVMLLADPYGSEAIIYERFIYVMLGIGVGLFVMHFIGIEKIKLKPKRPPTLNSEK